MTALLNPFQVELQKLLSPHDMAWERTMPSDWKYGAPIGNGDFGACVYGQPRELSFVIGKNDVWDRRKDTRSWTVGESFQDLVRRYREDGPEERKKFQAELMRHGPPEPGGTELYRMYWKLGQERTLDVAHQTTCGTLRLHLDEGLNPDNLAMRIDLLRGEWRMTYDFGREVTALVSRAYDVLMVTLDRGTPNPDPWPVAELYDWVHPLTELPFEFVRPPLDVNPRMVWRQEGSCHVGTQSFAAGGRYVVGIRVTGFESVQQTFLPGRIQAVAQEPQGRKVTLYMTVATSWESLDPEQVVRERLERAVTAGADVIRQENTVWWHDYWMRGLGWVDDPLITRPYYRSLYLNASTVRAGCQSPGLQGVWCGENYPVWQGDYHSNINIQCMYWGLYTNNRLEMVEPFFRLYEGMVRHARELARDYFKMRGLKFPHAGSINGHELSGACGCHLATDPCESVWIAALFWDYYRYTGDRSFLRDRAYPIIRDVALFTADYMTWDQERGEWTMDPVVHFETQRESGGDWGRNSLGAQSFFRMAFQMAGEAAEILNVDPEFRSLWKERLEKMAPVPVSSEGYWKSWEDSPPTYRGHNFMLSMVFPAGLVSAEHGPEEWRKQAQATWREIVDNKRSTKSGGQWCGGQGIAEILRLGERELAYNNARWEMTPANGFNLGYGGYGGHFMQADNVVGMSRVLADFLVLELGGVIHLFYGIPESRTARFFGLRAPGGFVISAAKTAGRVEGVWIQSTCDGTLSLANPWSGQAVTAHDMSGGSPVTYGGDKVLKIEMKAGQTVQLKGRDTSVPAFLPFPPLDADAVSSPIPPA